MVIEDAISSFALLSVVANKLERGDDVNASRVLLASVKGFLPSFKSNVIAWMKAKVDVRRIFLQDSSSTTASQLLKSNVWSKNMFDQKVVETIVSFPDAIRLGVQKVIG